MQTDVITSSAEGPRPTPPDPDGRARAWLGRRTLSTRGLAFAAVYVIWGSTYLAIRVGVASIPPLLLAGTRSLLAGGALLGWWLLRGARLPNRAEWGRAAVSGVAMLTGGNGLVTLAETRVPSNLAALMIAGLPAYVALLDWLRPGGTRPSRRALGGIALGSLGMLLLVRPDGGALEPGHWRGVAALVLAGVCWAFGSLYIRHSRHHPSAGVAGAQQMLAGGAALLLLGLGRGELHQLAVDDITRASVLAFIYLTVFGSMIAFSAFTWLVSRTTPTELATTAYVNPLVALILGWLVLGEALHPVALGGAALIIAAVILMSGRSGRTRPPDRTGD